MVQKTESCWLWQGTKDRLGYGRLTMRLDGKRVQLAHRAAFILVRGYHPPALDHLCRNSSCVRPDHLDPCGQSENAKRQQWPACCPHGHEYVKSNTAHYVNKRGYKSRLCLACKADYQRRYRATRRAA